ncbi:MAG: MBL fold metallo-hydrolase [Syntrophales bacterium]|jgi:glyoxylase-like metal-dependent hydrolase (beta-lactamase superfamily II)|nr:MBL fold metallo-hydrolase [Syntrophales bacterium]MDY0043941.1 MBL fold metallo-hydrolase [Syntrophales bacterium]
MIDEVMKDFYRIAVPLPNSPLKELNSYFIKGEDRNLIIDTGFNRAVCFEAMQEGIEKLEIDLMKTDFFITHMHADHSGLVTRLATESSTIHFSRIDSQVFKRDGGWNTMLEFAGINGFPENELMRALNNHPGFKYSPQTVPDFSLIDDGDIITVGDYRLQCIATPGHTPGHICLYEADKKAFLSGDHILYDITPHIESWAYQINSLQDYIDSLEKVYTLDVDIVLPGHRNFFTDLKGRIDELKEHHESRANETLEVLGHDRKNAYEIAAGMTWDIDCESWDVFPIAQKWFATGEAIAHLRYLESEGRVKRNTDSEIVTFTAA